MTAQVPFFIHFTLAVNAPEGPDRRSNWTLTPDTYSLPKGPPPLEPTVHDSALDACEAGMRLAREYGAGWTIRSADGPAAREAELPDERD